MKESLRRNVKSYIGKQRERERERGGGKRILYGRAEHHAFFSLTGQ